MNKENSGTLKAGEHLGRLTRARAAALRACGQLPPLKDPVQGNQKQPLQLNSKRAASDNSGLHPKKRVVLQDVTNVCCENSYGNCFNATKVQAKSRLAKAGRINVSKVVPSVPLELTQIQVDSKAEIMPETLETELASEDATIVKDNVLLWPSSINECGADDNLLESQASGLPFDPLIPQKTANKGGLLEILTASKDPEIADIDADYGDPQQCSHYAAEIYKNLRVAECARRPYPKFMETIQRDITQSMRAILVDWLVEVSEEYKLSADTLYLTIYLVDWFLSKNYIERQGLQLLGITCMLIALKYEEFNAPPIEEFCFITDNTYTKEEVLKMEIQVLKCSNFQLFAPTTKNFLRRFLRAAQASYETFQSPSLELEYLANYLAELTLMDYGFLNFRPSIIAASAVFLARWTLDQSNHPWNPTLQHHTGYEASDLKSTVLALQDLQLKANDCLVKAIHTKYKQNQFKCVAALSSPKLLQTLF